MCTHNERAKGEQPHKSESRFHLSKLYGVCKHADVVCRLLLLMFFFQNLPEFPFFLSPFLYVISTADDSLCVSCGIREHNALSIFAFSSARLIHIYSTAAADDDDFFLFCSFCAACAAHSLVLFSCLGQLPLADKRLYVCFYLKLISVKPFIYT